MNGVARHNKKPHLTPAEQKTTAAFKLLSENNKTLKRSLKKTQDELEKYREKYHAADKDNAIHNSKNKTLLFHEFLKFFVSIVFGGLGANLFTGGNLFGGLGLIITGLILYGIIVFTDKKNF